MHPLGLVAKGSTWYLIAGTDAGLRTFRLWRIRTVELTGDAVHRPADFDLATAWQSVVERMDQHRHVVEVEALVARWLVGPLRGHFGVRLRVEPTDTAAPRAAVAATVLTAPTACVYASASPTCARPGASSPATTPSR